MLESVKLSNVNWTCLYMLIKVLVEDTGNVVLLEYPLYGPWKSLNLFWLLGKNHATNGTNMWIKCIQPEMNCTLQGIIFLYPRLIFCTECQPPHCGALSLCLPLLPLASAMLCLPSDTVQRDVYRSFQLSLLTCYYFNFYYFNVWHCNAPAAHVCSRRTINNPMMMMMMMMMMTVLNFMPISQNQ